MTTKEKILEAVRGIPEEKLADFLKMVEDFKKKNNTDKEEGKWDRFFGILTSEQAETMRRSVEDEFERIEEDAV